MLGHFFDPEILQDLQIADWGYTTDSKPLSFELFKQWTQQENCSELSYLYDHRKDLRSDLKNIFPEFKSAFVFIFPYSHVKDHAHFSEIKVARYSLGFDGFDYHYVLKERLKKIEEILKIKKTQIDCMAIVDTAPVLERDLAYRAGLGWFGKNSMLIHKQEGSFFMIASLLTSEFFEISPKPLVADHCGTCVACIEHCPTQAIDPSTRTLIAAKCISTFTIETFSEKTPPKGFETTSEIFGCDICQDVCPWNKKPLKAEKIFSSESKMLSFLHDFFSQTRLDMKDAIEKMSARQFQKFFKGTVFSRPTKKGFLKNFL